MNLITELIKEMERQDRVNDIDLSGVVEILYDADKAYDKAIAVTRCCMSETCGHNELQIGEEAETKT